MAEFDFRDNRLVIEMLQDPDNQSGLTPERIAFWFTCCLSHIDTLQAEIDRLTALNKTLTHDFNVMLRAESGKSANVDSAEGGQA